MPVPDCAHLHGLLARTPQPGSRLHQSRFGRALLFVLALLTPLIGTSAASAATIRTEPDGSWQKIVYTGSDAPEALVFARTDFQDFIFQSFLRGAPAATGTPINVFGNWCENLGGANTVNCFRDGTVSLSADAKGGVDWIQLGQPVGFPLFDVRGRLDGGDGDDFIEAGAARDTLIGGSGDDVLSDFPGDDIDDGGPGDDAIYPGHGNDTIDGGPGIDRVDYYAWDHSFDMTTARVIDRISGATDTLTNVENLFGSNMPDTITGDDDSNHLVGLRGPDAITGGGGQDRIDAGLEDDAVDAWDGVTDFVDCGPGADRVTADTTDVISGCETKQLSDEKLPDADGDGSDKTSDCDDRNRALHPGAVDVPENGIDENCDGVDAEIMDRDRDGHVRPHDCDDANPAINPRATEIPGNRVDEDCHDGPAPYPLLSSSVGYTATLASAYTRFTELYIRRAHAGSRVRVRCTGGGCSPRARRLSVRRNAAKLVVTRMIRAARLRPGARLEVRITRRGHVGVVARFRIRAGQRLPKRTDRCLRPGARRPSRCPI